MEKKYFCRIWN